MQRFVYHLSHTTYRLIQKYRIICCLFCRTADGKEQFSVVMKDVVVYVDIRSDTENRSKSVRNVIANHGIKVNVRLSK